MNQYCEVKTQKPKFIYAKITISISTTQFIWLLSILAANFRCWLQPQNDLHTIHVEWALDEIHLSQ